MCLDEGILPLFATCFRLLLLPPAVLSWQWRQHRMSWQVLRQEMAATPQTAACRSGWLTHRMHRCGLAKPMMRRWGQDWVVEGVVGVAAAWARQPFH